MKVLHVLDHSLPLHSGYAFRTVAILREQMKLGWETLQLTTPRQGVSDQSRQVIEGFTFLRSAAPTRGGIPGEMLATARSLEAAALKFLPGVIHAHSPVLAGLPALRVARRLRIPMVYEVRALWEDAAVDHGSSSEGGLRYRLSRSLESYVLRRADHVTTICEGLRQEIVGRGVPAEKVTVIPNAVDVTRFDDSELNKRPGSARANPNSALQLGFIGSFYHYEGLDLLIRAIAQLVQDGLAVELWLVGGGPEDENLRQLSKHLNVESSVVFTGRVKNTEVAEYYRKVDALVYPRRSSRLTEMVTPLKPLESMANRRLVLASDIGGHRELVRHGETGILFPADDVDALSEAIREAQNSKEHSAQIIENGFSFVCNERTWTNSVARYENIYKGLRKTAGQYRDQN